MKFNLKNRVHIDKASVIVDDTKPNVVLFKKPLVITNDAEHHSGVRYNVDGMDVAAWNGKITADHADRVDRIVGNAIGLTKKGKKVTINGIDFASEQNPYALLSRNMMVAGYLSDVSIETLGTWPNDDGVIEESKLVGLSLVVQGNNPDSHLNSVIKNSLVQAKELGLDTQELEQQYKLEKETKEDDMKFVTIKNTRGFAVQLSYKNAAGDQASIKLEPGMSIDVSEDQAELLNSVIANAQEPNQLTAEFESLKEELHNLKKDLVNARAQEPTFQSAQKVEAVEGMSGVEILQQQVNAYFSQDMQTLRSINQKMYEKYKKEGLIKNTVSIESFGNLILPPEIITDIQRCETNYRPLLDVLGFQETQSLEFIWGVADGTIDMQPVALCDDEVNPLVGLKPLTEYQVNPSKAQLAEAAGVTVVCDSATRFLAVDALADIAAEYRRDYDRKLAQLVIARLQQAVDATGNKVVYNISTSDAAEALESWIYTRKQIISCAPNGVFIMSESSLEELRIRMLRAGILGGDISAFTDEALRNVLGKRMVIVPDDLMPELNSAQTRQFLVNRTTDRSIVDTVTITEGLFYVDPTTWRGKVSGGLDYRLSDTAAYEVSDGEGGTLARSAFQRDQTVIRGAFYRGGDVLMQDKVSSMTAPGVS